jgi:hypothetical protein
MFRGLQPSVFIFIALWNEMDIGLSRQPDFLIPYRLTRSLEQGFKVTATPPLDPYAGEGSAEIGLADGEGDRIAGFEGSIL